MNIGIDIDGVLADFIDPYRRLITSVTGRDLWGPNPGLPTCWSFDKAAGYLSVELMGVWNAIKASQDFWLTLPALPFAWDAGSILCSLSAQGHNVYYITSRPGRTAKWQTEQWLRIYGDDTPTVCLSDHKGTMAKGLDLDYYLDDRLRNVIDVAVQSPSTRTFLLDRPWNQIGPRVDLGEIPDGLDTMQAGRALESVRRISSIVAFFDPITKSLQT